MGFFRVGLDGRDSIEVKYNEQGLFESGRVKACLEITRQMALLRKNFGADVKKWPIPDGNDHGSMLIRELILKVTGQWQFPYSHDEVCHCRTVSTHTVDQAIVAGASSVEQIQRETLASTSCGTCRPDVESIIRYRRK